ncbi:MAG: DUF1552 domain-containing protein [Planctomycetes bacterium]|nr:DUF1552 domain-containing protein [Planctomycetota bacterium]
MKLPMFGRRVFLRGTGAALTLPWLEGIAERLPYGAEPKRMAILVMPNGALPSAWRPKSTDDGGFEPSFTLTPLTPWRQHVAVLQGLANRQSFAGDGHYAKVAPLLTGREIRRTGGRDLWNGESIDQLVARHVGANTLLPSLELGCDPIYPVEDMGYSSVYGGTIAWSAPDRPVTKEIVPRLVFDRLFRSHALAADPARPSVLDVVKRDAERLATRLGRRDQQRLTEFLDAVRALELRIDAAARHGVADVDPAKAPPPGVPGDHGSHVELMLDLIALAFEMDATRVVTFLLANEVSGRDFAFVEGCAGSFHEFSHHEGKPEKTEPYRRINRWYVERYAGLLARLAARTAGDGTLLDRCRIVFLAAMADGNAHDPHDLPVLLAGGAGGGFTPGKLVASPRDTALCRLWLWLAQQMGTEIAEFGDATQPLF